MLIKVNFSKTILLQFKKGESQSNKQVGKSEQTGLSYWV
jgi:hypothetical protein